MSCRVERICGFSTQFKRSITQTPRNCYFKLSHPTCSPIVFYAAVQSTLFSYLDKVIEPNTNALAQLKLSMRLDHMEQTLPAFYGNQDQKTLREEYTTLLKCNHLKRTIPFS